MLLCRWIDWPHSHGDPNEYWQRLGTRKFIGGPRVLNSSELNAVFASPYMFARKVDVEVDSDVLRIWDSWMARKLGGEHVSPPQAPIGHSPGDPFLSLRFRAPGSIPNASPPKIRRIVPIACLTHKRRTLDHSCAMRTGLSFQHSVRKRRRIAKVEFEDGSHCGCGHLCEALEGGCCELSMCRPSEGEDIGDAASQDAVRIHAGTPTSEAANSLAQLNETNSTSNRRRQPCQSARKHAQSLPGGKPIVVSWINRARYPVQLSVSTRRPLLSLLLAQPPPAPLRSAHA